MAEGICLLDLRQGGRQKGKVSGAGRLLPGIQGFRADAAFYPAAEDAGDAEGIGARSGRSDVVHRLHARRQESDQIEERAHGLTCEIRAAGRSPHYSTDTRMPSLRYMCP